MNCTGIRKLAYQLINILIFHQSRRGLLPVLRIRIRMDPIENGHPRSGSVSALERRFLDQVPAVIQQRMTRETKFDEISFNYFITLLKTFNIFFYWLIACASQKRNKKRKEKKSNFHFSFFYFCHPESGSEIWILIRIQKKPGSGSALGVKPDLQLWLRPGGGESGHDQILAHKILVDWHSEPVT